jgi:hypothetical protein
MDGLLLSMVVLILAALTLLCFCFVYSHMTQTFGKQTILSTSYDAQIGLVKPLLTMPMNVFQTLSSFHINERFFVNVIGPKLQMNRELTFHFYDNDRIDRFLLQHFPSYIHAAYKKINPKFGACLSDFARYCLIYIYGGVYMDIKSDIKKNLYPFLKQHDKPNTLIVAHWRWISPQSSILPFEQGELQNWAFIATPRHPVLKLVIDNMVRLLHSNVNGTTKQFVLELTGPVMFSRVIHRSMQDKFLEKTIVITDELNDYFSYTKVTFDCRGDCKTWLYDKMTHYSNVGEDVIIKNEDTLGRDLVSSRGT